MCNIIRQLNTTEFNVSSRTWSRDYFIILCTLGSSALLEFVKLAHFYQRWSCSNHMLPQIVYMSSTFQLMNLISCLKNSSRTVSPVEMSSNNSLTLLDLMLFIKDCICISKSKLDQDTKSIGLLWIIPLRLQMFHRNCLVSVPPTDHSVVHSLELDYNTSMKQPILQYIRSPARYTSNYPGINLASFMHLW